MGAELRRLHGRIRGLLNDAREGALSPDRALDTDLTVQCRAFCSALGRHHRAEDAVLFPWLLDAHPGLAPVVDRLEEDHAVIGTLLGDLERALGERAPASVVVQHLDGLDAIMESHFRFEERELVAVLDAADAGGSDLDDLWRAHDRGRSSSDERLAPGGGPVDR